MADNTPKYDFKAPSKEVKSPMDIQKWLNSETYHELNNFIQTICKCITAKPNSSKCFVSPSIEKLLKLLDHLQKLVELTPPINQPQRFGNAAYKTWHKLMSESFEENCGDLIPADAIVELKPYFVESFGNATRIDYGTGHELTFVMFIMGLFKIGALLKSDELAVALKVFNKYLSFVRTLQLTYKMEPAGRWDEIAWIWVMIIKFNITLSATESGHSMIISSFHSSGEVRSWRWRKLIRWSLSRKRRLMSSRMNLCLLDALIISAKWRLDTLQSIGEMNGSLREWKCCWWVQFDCSNQLWSISAVSSWSKICQGLIKMYQKEVLSKFPVIQHILFGSIFTLNPPPPKQQLKSV